MRHIARFLAGLVTVAIIGIFFVVFGGMWILVGIPIVLPIVFLYCIGKDQIG